MSKKSLVKVVGVVLSLLILLTALPLGVSAADTATVTPDLIVEDVTFENKDVVDEASPVNLTYEYETIITSDDRSWTYVAQSQEGYCLNTIDIDNGDGTHTMILYDYPVKYVDEKDNLFVCSIYFTVYRCL